MDSRDFWKLISDWHYAQSCTDLFSAADAINNALDALAAPQRKKPEAAIRVLRAAIAYRGVVGCGPGARAHNELCNAVDALALAGGLAELEG